MPIQYYSLVRYWQVATIPLCFFVVKVQVSCRMASLLVQDLLSRKEGDVQEFIKRACLIALDFHGRDQSKELPPVAALPLRNQGVQLCDVMELISDLLSNSESKTVGDVQELHNVFTSICYPVLHAEQGASASQKSSEGVQDCGTRMILSICRLIAAYLQKTCEQDPDALEIKYAMQMAVHQHLEDAHGLSGSVGHSEANKLVAQLDPSTINGPSFSVFSAMDVLEHLQDSSSEAFISDLSTTDWYQEMMACAINGLDHSESVVCARLCGILMKEGLTTEMILQEVWTKVQNMYHKSEMVSSPSKNRGSNIYLILCVLADRLLSPDIASSSEALSMFHMDITFWKIIRQGMLCHHDPLTRKRAVFLLKRALEVLRSQKKPSSIDVEPGKAEVCPLIKWVPDDESKLLQIWNDFVLFYEALGEVQIHVVQPVLTKWNNLLDAARPEKEGKVYLRTSWLTLLLERSFKHESKTITRWGVEQTLKLDVTAVPLMSQGGDEFLFGPFLSILREDYLYMRSDDAAPLGQRPLTACQVEEFLSRILAELPTDRIQVFHRQLVTSICKLSWGPIPLTLLLEVISRLPDCQAWNSQQLYDFRELMQSSVSVFHPAFRSCIQTFLSLSAIRFVDLSSVALHEVFTFIASLNVPGPLRKGDQIWNQICTWLIENKGTNNLASGESSFAKDLKEKLTGGDHPSEDNGSSLHEVEVERLALEVLMLTDVHCIKPSSNSNHADNGIVFNTLTLPLREVLTSVGSRIYLPPGQADRSIQVLTVIVNLVLESVVTQITDPVIKQLNMLLNESVAEILTYLKRRIFSLDVGKATSLGKVHIYLELLTALDRYCTSRKSTNILPATAELNRFKASLIEDCQAVLTSSKDTQTPQALFKAYVAMEMISWRLHCSHGNKDVFKQQDFYTTILHLEINNLHDSKKFPVEQRGSTGRLIGIFLGRKWSCVRLFMEAGHVTINYEDTLRRCIHELSLVSDLNSRLIMDCGAILIRKLVSSCPDLCCEAITVAWCCVLDFYRNRHFWEIYISFVHMTFQLEMMTEGPETPVFTTISKVIDLILDKGESKLGLVNLVISNICRTWQRLTAADRQIPDVVRAMTNYTYLLKKSVLFGSFKKEGRLREEMLFYLSSNDRLGAIRETLQTTSIEKDPSLVRVAVVNMLIRLGETKSAESQTFLVDFLKSLIEEDVAVTPQGKCYVINSQVHRIKQRIWQAALVIVNYISEDSSSHIFQQILIQLASENQSSAKHMMEWLIVLMIHRFPSTVTQFWARLDQMIAGSRSGFSPILIIISHLGSVQPTKEAKVSFYTKAIPIIFPWSMAPTVSLRVQSQVALYKIWLDCRRDGLSEVLDRFPALNASMEYNENRGSAITNKMEGNFFLKDFHPLLDYSLETIFQSLPYLTLVIEDELVLPQMFSQESRDLWSDGYIGSIPLFNKRDTLRLAQKLGKAAEKRKFVTPGSSVDLNVIDYKEKSLPLGGDVQKKITPLREELAPGFGDDQSTTEAKRGQLVVVATLVDRMPNLGGLCRTSEIFGVDKLIVGSARYLEDKSFLGLSVTAEKWLPMREVRPSELKDYLSEMRQHGYTLVGLEQTANSVQINEYRFPVKTVLLLGNERTGIPVDLIHHLDVCVEIPQLGYIRSLNVHVSGALMIWEYTRQMLGLG